MTAATPVDDSATTKKEMTLPELRKYEGQLFIQNNTPNKITFHERMGDKYVDFELDPAGEPDSIAFLPKLALDMRGLQKLWMKGSISISQDPEMEEQIMMMNAQAVGASDARMKTMLGMQTANANHKDLIEKMCLVSGRKNPVTGVIEQGRVLQTRREEKDGVPPLAPEFKHMEKEFVPRLVSDDKGNTHWEFDRMQVGPTIR